MLPPLLTVYFPTSLPRRLMYLSQAAKSRGHRCAKPCACFLQPVGETAEVPFRTNVWAGTEHNVEAQFLCRADELGEVGLTFEVEHARLALVDVPENVGRNAVDAHSFCAEHAVAPVFLRDARIVHLSAYQGDGLAVEPELAFSILKSWALAAAKPRTKAKKMERIFFMINQIKLSR